MQVQAVQRDVRLSDGLSSHAFTIQANAKMFSILADKLYSDKMLAVIREYACNQLDAHALTGQTRPFLIAAPSTLVPMAVFRDFGPGMSHADVMQRFTSFGDSSKNDNPDQIGGFGLGCKSGFAYTDAFTVASIQAGEKRVYAAFRGSDGIPQMSVIETLETEEEDGFEVRIPIKDADFYRFGATAKRVLEHFPEGSYQTFGFEVEPPTYDVLTDTYGILSSSPSSSYVLMGPVAYPLDWSQVTDHEMPRSIVPIFPVGALDLQPSREGLSYDPITVQRLKDRYDEITLAIAEQLHTQIQALPRWQQLEFIKRCRGNNTWKLVCGAFGPEGFPGITDYIALPGRPVAIDAKESYRRRRHQVTLSDGDRKDEEVHIGLENIGRAVFVFDDLRDLSDTKKRVTARLKERSTNANFYVFDRDSGVDNFEAVKALFDGYPYLDQKFELLSELEPPEGAKKARLTGPTRLRVLSHQCGKSTQQWGRNTYWNEKVELVESGVYVPLNGYDVEGGASLENYYDYKWVRDFEIYGLSKKARTQLNDGFIRLDDYIRGLQKAALADPLVLAEIERRHVISELQSDRELQLALQVLKGRKTLGGPSLFPDLEAKLDSILEEPSAEVAHKAACVEDYRFRRAEAPAKVKRQTKLISSIKKIISKYPLLLLAIELRDNGSNNLLSPKHDELLLQLNRRTK